MPFSLGFWAAAGAGGAGGGAMELISTTVLSSSSSSVTFNSIPSTYKNLQIRFTARNVEAANGAIYVRLNGDSSSANYTFHRLYGNGSSVAADGSGTGSYSGLFAANIPGSNSSANIFGAGIVDVLGYGETTKYKTLRSLNGVYGAATIVALNSSVWINTAAITSLTCASNATFDAGSRFSLYGIKA